MKKTAIKFLTPQNWYCQKLLRPHFEIRNLESWELILKWFTFISVAIMNSEKLWMYSEDVRMYILEINCMHQKLFTLREVDEWKFQW